jgi:hypothetical protein
MIPSDNELVGMKPTFKALRVDGNSRNADVGSDSSGGLDCSGISARLDYAGKCGQIRRYSKDLTEKFDVQEKLEVIVSLVLSGTCLS